MLLTDFPVPNIGIQHKQDNTTAFVDGTDTGKGSLYIAESQVTWLSSTGAGFCLEYPKICLHAISRDLSSFPHECLYVQVEGKLIEDDRQSNSSSENDDDDEMPITEVRFVPDDKGALEAIYSALCHCQTLHPDPEDADSDEQDEGEGQDGFYEGEESVNELTEQGQVTLQRLENMLRQGQGDGATTEQTNGHVEEAMESETPNSGGGGQFDDAEMDQ